MKVKYFEGVEEVKKEEKNILRVRAGRDFPNSNQLSESVDPSSFTNINTKLSPSTGENSLNVHIECVSLFYLKFRAVSSAQLHFRPNPLDLRFTY